MADVTAGFESKPIARKRNAPQVYLSFGKTNLKINRNIGDKCHSESKHASQML
jgi:hypothetical protein